MELSVDTVASSEQHDVAQSHIAIWQELRGLADKWEADVDAEAKQRPPPRNDPESTGPTRKPLRE